MPHARGSSPSAAAMRERAPRCSRAMRSCCRAWATTSGIEGLEAPLRFALERIRALSLMQRGRHLEAERVAIALTAGAAKGGTRAHAAQALAIAARAGAPDAWLLRWLGALACATGSAAR